ncbi:MFS transporter [Rhodococcus baikonurensis]|uniref:MFS transporter n=1 Tax=Rhodococcus erythropolis group TaxID=2840174 RepID=UPI000BB2D688|nr:MFS transporter [Rhodococcus erythropolis]PBI86854.1 Proline/betaine transporter [Rhodococcus erythropolis]
MNKHERKVVGASAIGTAFEWYDFFLYGALVPVIGSKFFGEYSASAQTVFALLTFAAGFMVRPIGAVVFARLTDQVGRKVVFLITLIIMGVSTVAVGLLPTSEQIGIVAPILLVTCRILQGLAVSGEFGAAVTYVSEYAPPRDRGYFVGWLTGTTALAFSLSVAVQLVVEAVVGTENYDNWGWRIPFLIAVVPLALSVWIRSSLHESPLFQQMKANNTTSKAPLREAFSTWPRIRTMLIVFVMASAQSFIGYVSTVYMLTLMKTNLGIDSFTVNAMYLVVMFLGFFLCIGACRVSDRVGRRPVLFAGLGLAAVLMFPLVNSITSIANPELGRAVDKVSVTLAADPSTCSFQFNPAGNADFTSECDVAREILQTNSVRFDRVDLDGGSTAVSVGDVVVESSPTFSGDLRSALVNSGYPIDGSTESILVESFGDMFDPRVLAVMGLLLCLVLFAQMAQGPASVTMVEVFPTRIRATALSLPYQLGVGVFGGLLPAMMVAIGAEVGSFTTALWYPVIAMALGLLILIFTLPETKGTDISDVQIKGDTAEIPEPLRQEK